MIRREVYERLLQRWPEFRLKFPPTEIRHFEEDGACAAKEKEAVQEMM